MKIEKERKFKREYIPVVLAGLILLFFVILLFLTINYEPKAETSNNNDTNEVVNEDLAIDKEKSKCNTEELNEVINAANKISGTYSLQVKKVAIEDEENDNNLEYYTDGLQDYKYIEILIKGITDDVYVKINNSYNDEVKVIKASDLDENKEYKYEAPTMDERVSYTLEIYSNKYDCIDEVVRKVVFDTRIYNTYSSMLACLMYPNYSNCATFVNKPMTFEEFNSGLNEYREKHEEEEAQAQANVFNAFYNKEVITAEDIEKNEYVSNKNKGVKKVIKKINENRDLILIALSIIGIGVLVVILLMFIRRNKL